MLSSRSNNQNEYLRPPISVRKQKKRSTLQPISTIPNPSPRITDPRNQGSSTLTSLQPLSSRCPPAPFPKSKLDRTYSNLQDFYDQATKTKNQLAVQSLPNLSTSRSASQTSIDPLALAQLVAQRKPRQLVIPPLPPHIRRCFATTEAIEPKKHQVQQKLPGIHSFDKIGDKCIAEEQVQNPHSLSAPSRFRHPNEIRSIPNKVESYENIHSKVICSSLSTTHQRPVPVVSPPSSQCKPKKLGTLVRSASLPQMSNIDSMQSRYLTDLEWRVCHAVNIYVYKNGVENQSPILVHIPPAMKANMKLVLRVLNERVKYPVGYARTLYRMNGTKVCEPCDLETYNNYVVASNNEKHFKCVTYGRRKSPLLVLNPQSKHTRAMREQSYQLRCCLAKKTSIDSLGYICPRGSMEVIRGMGCCQPGEAVSKGPETTTPAPKRGRSPGKSNPNPNRTKSSGKNPRSKSSGPPGSKNASRSPSPGPPGSKNASRSPSPGPPGSKNASRSPSPAPASAGARTRGPTPKSAGSAAPKVKKVQVHMVNELKLDSQIKHMTSGLRDLNGNNNNNLVDALIALERSEHKYPPLSTGVSSTMDASPFDHSFNDIYKNRAYSESEFEAEEEESYDESDGQLLVPVNPTTSNQSPKSKDSNSGVCNGFPAQSGTYKSPRGRTYTIRFHTQSPRDPDQENELQEPGTATSALSTSRSWQDTCSNSGLAAEKEEPEHSGGVRRKASFDIFEGQGAQLESLLLIPPPATVPHATFSERNGFLIPPTKSYSQGFNLENLDPVQQDIASPRILDFEFQEDSGGFPRHLLQTRGFTPLEDENMGPGLWLPLPRVTSTEYSNRLIPPPEIYKVQTDRSIQSTPPPDWMKSYYGGQGKSYTSLRNNGHFFNGNSLPDDPDVIPPPSAFQNVIPGSSNLIPPPTRFSDDEFLFRQESASTTSLTRLGSKVRSKTMLIRRRPTLTYPVEDYIFKKGMKSPVRTVGAPKTTVNPHRKSPITKVKPKPRFRR